MAWYKPNGLCWYEMIKKLCASLVKIYVFLSFILMADTSLSLTYMEQLQQQGASKKLYEASYWLALGHYSVVDEKNKKYESYTDEQAFFLSDSGKYSPKDELNETIKAFFDQSSMGVSHPQCRFVARLNWLVDELSIDRGQLPTVNCEEYLAWRKAIHAETVTLIFASHFVNSPSSMYGHTLLRIDPPKSVNPSQWLSYAVNFGASIGDDDNSMFFAWNGLTGGYPGTFSMAPYYKKINQYSSMENRGLWEYQLNLTVDEVNKLVSHLWELKDIRFDYYFSDENCSFRLLELLEIARPNVDLLSGFDYKAIPTDTVRVVRDHQMIKRIDYRASHVEKIKYIASFLSDEHKALARDLSLNTALIDSEVYGGASMNEKKRILYVAYNYLRYEQRKIARDKGMARRSRRLLLEINGQGGVDLSAMQRPFDPIEGHETMSVDISVGDEGGEGYVEGQWRMSYHDLLDPSPGYPLGLGIEMLGLTARQWEGGRTTLERLDVVEINSFAARDVFFKPYSWRVNGGLERVYNDLGDELVPQVSGGGGYSFGINEDFYYYTLITGRYEYNEMYQKNNQLGLGVAVGVLGSVGNINTSFEIAAQELTNGEERSAITFNIHYTVAKNQTLRFEIENVREGSYQENNIKLGYRYYY
jgi:Domain of unknown function (DUF4105)